MNILVTGGAGYVGWSVVQSLARQPEITTIKVFDNFSRGNYGIVLEQPTHAGKLQIHVDDILNSHGLRAAMDGMDCVCHLAALAPSPFSDENPHAFDQLNHWGTAEVCYACEDLDIKRLIYVSSGAVYGFGDSAFSNQSTPLPATAYGSSKLAGEQHVKRLSEKLETAIMRSGTVYGINPVARFDTFINRFVLHAALGRPLHIHGSGQQARPVIHVERLAEAVTQSVLAQSPTGLMDNVDLNISVRSVARTVQNLKPGIDLIFTNQQARLRDLKILPAGNQGIDEEATTNFERDIRDILARIEL